MRCGTKISSEVLERLIRFHGEKLVFPQWQAYYFSDNFTRWHVKDVFQGEYREL